MTVTQIPTNKPVQRTDKADLIYISQKVNLMLLLKM